MSCQEAPPAPLLVSITSAALMLGGISRRSVERLIASGRLPSHRIGGRRLIPRIAVERLARQDVPRIAGAVGGSAS